MTKVIKVTDSTYNRLADYGRWTDTMDDIIKRLIIEADRNQTDANFKKETGECINEFQFKG